jgi:hypothetical protein
MALVMAAASACSGTPMRIDSLSLGNRISQSPERFIIVAVADEPTTYVARAGSTPRGYDAIVDYGPTVHARQVMRALEKDYALTEVSAWPIDALHLHCAVLEVPADADRKALLIELSKDSRIKLTQPLQTFATLTESGKTETYNDPYIEL